MAAMFTLTALSFAEQSKIISSDAHVEDIMNHANFVYEVKQGWRINDTLDLQAATKRTSTVDTNMINCNFNNRRDISNKEVRIGVRLVISKVVYKKTSKGFAYQVDVNGFDRNNQALTDLPIFGLICVTTQKITHVEDLIETGTGGAPIVRIDGMMLDAGVPKYVP